ncbi:MAG: glycosyltransferase [Acidobacteriia bacterium]|nr:glycosyltransferase [Terriglobia bacterium]
MFSWESLHSIAVGGIAAHVTELAAALQRQGHDVHIFARLGYGGNSVHRIDGVWYHFEWARWMGRNGRAAAETTFTWDKIADLTLSCYQS